jgi:class 3 adenylate cyclase/tetratricopeptide (TPR) repeat protein
LDDGELDCYVPRVLLRRLATASQEPVMTEAATVVFVDISGFTRLSERLSRKGKEGAEHLVEAINSCFSVVLAEAYANGGSLLKFGGDALLLWFEGDHHPLRGCSSAVAMRRTLRRISPVKTGGADVPLRMSVGVHSGSFDTFLVGGSHREYLLAGPAASTVVAMEAAAASGEILVSNETAALLPKGSFGAARSHGVLLARSPAHPAWAVRETRWRPSGEAVAGCLSTVLRKHLLAAPPDPEHRTATVAFLQFGGVDELIEADGARAAAERLDGLMRIVQAAADRYEVCVLGSDIALDGGKLILAGGVPRAVGEDAERVLLAVREILDAHPPLRVRVGITRGHVFSGEVGPPYRRTYTVMGDAVNLAARLTANAPWRAIHATPGVLERSRTRFETGAVAPFMAKGKLKPVQAVEIGAARRATAPGVTEQRLPTVGRDHELAVLRRAIAAAREGRGRLVEIVGETGSGKSRLLDEARQLGKHMRFVHATCEAYTQTLPYSTSRDLLRQVVGLGFDESDEAIVEHLRRRLASTERELLVWLPLLAIALGAEAGRTVQVQELSADLRTSKLHEVVLRFLAPALREPTLVQIEHAHLMDEASAAMLHALTSSLHDSRWVVIVTRRDIPGGFVGVESGAERLELGVLSPAAALALAEQTPEAHMVPPHLVELAVERSGGSPEFLLDLLAAAAGGSEELPDNIAAAATARIDALDPDDRTLVRRASVLGLRFPPHHLPHVLSAYMPPPDQETWERLGGIFALDPDGHIRFKRPALCEAAYESLPFRLRRELHLAIARSLEREGDQAERERDDIERERVEAEGEHDHHVDAEPAVLSLHFSRAGDHARAWEYALIGAKWATSRFAHADASRLYRRAIEAGRASGASSAALAEAWEQLGDALAKVGELPAAAHAFSSARRLGNGDPIAEARLCLRHGQLCQRTEMSTAVRWMSRGLRRLEHVPGDEARVWRARLIAELGWIRQRQRRYREAERLCREAIAEGQAAGALRAQARACYTLDWALFELGRFDEVTHSARALEIYRTLRDLEHEAAVLNNLGGFAYWRGRWQEAVDLYREAGACRTRAGNLAEVAETDANVGEILSDQGHLKEAEVHLRRAHRMWSSTGHREGAAFANMLLGRLWVRLGRAQEGIALLKATVLDMRRVGVGYYAELASALIAEAEAMWGDPERALALAGDLDASGKRNVAMLHRVSAIGLARMGDRDAAKRELELSMAAARERGEDYELALALDALATLGPLDQDRLAERDAIVARLGVVRLPGIRDGRVQLMCGSPGSPLGMLTTSTTVEPITLSSSRS